MSPTFSPQITEHAEDFPQSTDEQEKRWRAEAERLAATIDFDRLARDYPPPPEWFEREEPKPF